MGALAGLSKPQRRDAVTTFNIVMMALPNKHLVMLVILVVSIMVLREATGGARSDIGQHLIIVTLLERLMTELRGQ